MKDFLLEMVRGRFNIFCLLFLMVLLMFSHMAMIHWNRPAEMIHWEEGMITGVFSGLLALLGKPKDV